jgi:hypothetical protein
MSNIEKFKYKVLSDLPQWMRGRISGYELTDSSQWVHKKIPALGNRSIIEVMNGEPNGEGMIRDFMDRIGGEFEM